MAKGYQHLLMERWEGLLHISPNLGGGGGGRVPGPSTLNPQLALVKQYIFVLF